MKSPLATHALFFYTVAMIWAFFIAIAIGISTILQGGLNRILSVHWDLNRIVILNAIVYAAGSTLLLFLAKKYPSSFPEMFHPKGTFSSFSWWYLIPGIAGLLIVAGMPWVIAKIGTFQMMIIVVAVQTVTSLLWDKWVEDVVPTPLRLVGACLALGGAVLASIQPH